jgi:lambda family phage portal protein
MNFVDRVIGFVDPARGARRAAARLTMERMRRLHTHLAYEGAKTGRRTAGWRAVGTSADAELLSARDLLIHRSREQVQNNPYAAKALRGITAATIGTGIIGQPQDRSVKKVFDRWVEYADADGHLDFYGLQSLCARTIVESGAILVRFRWRRADDGLEVPLQIQALEPDHLDFQKSGRTAAGYIRAGIEYDLIGRVVAYWLFPEHPGDSGLPSVRDRSFASKRVPASEVVYAFDKWRPGQTHGVPWFSPSLLKMRDLDDYDDADMVRKKAEACFAAFVQAPEGAETAPVAQLITGANGQRIEAVEPGMVAYLAPGEEVTFSDPKPSQGYAEYVREKLHAIAAGVGVPYSLMTGDHSSATYMNKRAERLEFRSLVEEYRWKTLIPMVFTRVYREFLVGAFGAGLIRRMDVPISWTPPRWEYVDPYKDALADQLDVRNGFELWEEIVRRRGNDPESQIEAIALHNTSLDERDIVLDTDPRRVTKSGAGQSSDPLQTPAGEPAKPAGG